MVLRVPHFVRVGAFVIMYPTLYISWVKLMQHTWINNDIKDLHSQIIFPTAGRFTKTSSTYPHEQQFQESLIQSGTNGLKQQYLDKLSKAKKSKEMRTNPK